MTNIVSGQRLASFLLLIDDDGLRHAIRPGSILALSDGDDRLGTTCVQLPGGRIILIQAALEEVLTWLAG